VDCYKGEGVISSERGGGGRPTTTKEPKQSGTEKKARLARLPLNELEAEGQ